MIIGLLVIAAAMLASAYVGWRRLKKLWGTLDRWAIGNDADKLVAQFNSDWPTFVGKPTDKGH